MASSTLTSKGQVTIPKEVRERMGLTEGDRLEFVFDEQGRLVVRPESADPLGRLPGLLKHLAPERPVTVEEMREAVLRRAQKKYAARGGA
jgi:antitoxin PrlF